MAKEKTTLTERQQEVLETMIDTVEAAIDDMREIGPISREFSIVLTKLEEAEMWSHRGFEELGYEPADEETDEDDAPDDESDEDGDEDDTDDE